MGPWRRSPAAEDEGPEISTERLRSAVDDPTTRDRQRQRVVKAVVAALFVAVIVGLVPIFLDDEAAVREGAATILIGAAAIVLASIVVHRMYEDVASHRQLELDRSGYIEVEVEDSWDYEMASRGLAESEAPEEVRLEPVLRLTGVDLREAVLPGAELERTDLSNALLEGANLNAAKLTDCRLVGADLRHADLRGGDLRGARLEDASLEGARLAGAFYDESTTWPEGMPDAEKLGAIKIETTGPEEGPKAKGA